MGMKEWYMDRTVRKMSPEEKKGMMGQMMDKFFETMGPAEKKDLMNQMMPRMMDRMFEGMTGEDKQELMATMMPRMMMQMFGGESGMMGSGPDVREEGAAPGALKGFKPWECCPCREYCKLGCAPRGT